MKKILLSGIAIFALIQLIPYGYNYQSPETTKKPNYPKIINEPNWDSPKTKELFMKACADCHSNESKYPWYSKIAPVSWLVQHDIDEGREHFDISSSIQENKGHEAAEEIEDGEMPMSIYVLLHQEAKLSPEEKEILSKGLEKTFPSKED